jgi:hypothetical protein
LDECDSRLSDRGSRETDENSKGQECRKETSIKPINASQQGGTSSNTAGYHLPVAHPLIAHSVMPVDTGRSKKTPTQRFSGDPERAIAPDVIDDY